MKLLKRILLALLLVVIIGGTVSFFYFKNKFLSAPPNELTVSNLGQSFDFSWGSSTVGDKIEPHAFMFVPVRIPGVDHKMVMQFDVGATNTVLLYKNIVSINEKYGNIFKIDTVDGKYRVQDLALKIGNVDVKASSLGIGAIGNPINWADTTQVIKIGTVGNDFIEKNPITIDFKNQKIKLTSALDPDVKNEEDYQPFSFDGRKIFLKAKLNKKPVELWYDSGSSAFEFIVEEKVFNAMAKPGAKRETYTGYSWGKPVPIHNIESEGMFEFGKTQVPLNYVSYFEWPNKIQAFILKAANIGRDLGGMTGNKLFLDKTLILDAPNLRYKVIE
ncbi:hypothetical protein AAGF08_20170 [Algoriphagus sp. SE2]|uniref:hypothetical protein n=1 Tax=Algoriphagus sp. SE2 TaxID=3141536 RepID=UPI0031CCEAF7